jgi:hypothetical protein
LAFSRLTGAFDFMKRHFQAVVMLSAGTLAIFGALLMANRLTWVTTQLQSIMRSVGLEWLVGLG